MGQIINMILRQILRQAMQWGIRKGVNRMGQNPGKTGSSASPQTARNQQQTVKRIRQAMRVIRRIGR